VSQRHCVHEIDVFGIKYTRLIHEAGLKTKIADGILYKNQCIPPRI